GRDPTRRASNRRETPMQTPITKRRSGRRGTSDANVAPRRSKYGTTQSRFCTEPGTRPGLRAERLPHGYMTALYGAFTSRGSWCRRVGNIQAVLADFDQDSRTIPTKIWRFLK